MCLDAAEPQGVRAVDCPRKDSAAGATGMNVPERLVLVVDAAEIAAESLVVVVLVVCRPLFQFSVFCLERREGDCFEK